MSSVIASAFPPDAGAHSASEAPNPELGAYFFITAQPVDSLACPFGNAVSLNLLVALVSPDIRHACLICSQTIRAQTRGKISARRPGGASRGVKLSLFFG